MAGVRIPDMDPLVTLLDADESEVVSADKTYKQTRTQQLGYMKTNIAPLTTKGDMLGFSTLPLRIPVGANGSAIVADSVQAAGLKWSQPYFPVISDTGTGKTLELTDANTLQLLDNAATITITVPPNSSVAFPPLGETTINFTQIGAGQITIVAGVGVTILSYLSKLSTAGQNAQCSLTKLDTNVWQLTGTLI